MLEAKSFTVTILRARLAGHLHVVERFPDCGCERIVQIQAFLVVNVLVDDLPLSDQTAVTAHTRSEGADVLVTLQLSMEPMIPASRARHRFDSLHFVCIEAIGRQRFRPLKRRQYFHCAWKKFVEIRCTGFLLLLYTSFSIFL